MRASLIWPQFGDFSELDASWLPHGVTQIATEANARNHKVDILDGRVTGLEGMKQAVLDSTSEVIGISMLSSMVGWGEEIFAFLKERRPDIKTVLGGIHPTVCPEDFDGWGYDWLVKGEGELTFSDILMGIHSEGVVEGIKPDLAELHAPDRSLIKIEEKPMPGLDEPFRTVIIGRGCPYSCTFCQPAERKLFGAKLRYKPVEKVVEELQGIKSFMVHDDCFTSMPSYIRRFCDVITPLGLTWWCQGRADNVCNNIDLIRRMRDAGLRGMILGHESGDDRVLQSLNKGTTVAQNVEASRILKALGITVWSNIMVGLPGEPPSAVINTVAMLHNMQPDCLSVAVFTPHPGSRLYDECKEAGVMLRQKDDWTYYNRGKFEPKIAGPDYDFLAWACGQMRGQQ